MNSKYETKVFRIQTDGDNRFGFTLVGQYPCQLVRIQHGSPAELAGIRSGDEVLEVNGVNVEDLKHNCVATFITPNDDGITELRIRRPPLAKTLKSGHNVHKSVSEEVYITNADDLSQAVDRVVEGFKRPEMSAPSQQGLHLSVLNNDDIATDEQLKVNFSPVKPTINTPLTVDISTPVTLNLKLTPKNDVREKPPSSFEAIVCYLGSIQRPIVTKISTGLVTHLHVQKRPTACVLLEVGSTGIYVRNPNKQIIRMSPLNSLAYLGVCHENKQILAFFTEDLNTNEVDSNGVNNVAITSDCNLNCSCYVFMIESGLYDHANHKILMDSFQLLCDPETGSCQQYFPTSVETILNALQDISEESLTHITGDGNPSHYLNVNSHGSEVEILRELGVITPQELIKSDDSTFLLNSHCTQHDEIEVEQVLCVYLQPLYASARMKDKENDHPIQGDYSIRICGEKQSSTAWETSSATLETHNKVNKHIATSKGSSMADKDFLKPHDFVKPARSGHKTLVHQRSHSLASNMKNALQAHAAAAAAAVVAAAQTVECYTQDMQIGNGVRQIYHASSASILAGTTVRGDVEGKVARWAVAFDRLLEDETGLSVFKSFLQKEFSEENLIFWLACEKFKTLQDEKELKSCAEEIYEKHLKPCASLPVNVDSTAIKDVEANLQEPSTELFSSLQYQVYTLMKFDSYTRFLKSELYRECLMNEIEGKPLPVEHKEKVEKRDEDEGTSTLKRMFSSTKGKSRKASKPQTSSETDEIKKKSILPWRGRLKSDQPKRNTNRSTDSQASSTRSSLSSLSDSVFSSTITNSDETLNDSDSKDQTLTALKEQGQPTCKVILPNSSLMYLFCKSTRSLKEGLSKLCESKEYSLPALDIFLGGRKLTKEDLQRKLTRFINKEIVLKQKVLFRLELPNDRTIGIRTDDDQSVGETLEPILHQSGLDIKEYDIWLRDSDLPISTSSSVSLFHQKHVVVKEKAINKADVKQVLSAKEHLARTYAQHAPTKSITAIDHKVFEGIMTGKRQSMSGFCFDDSGVFVPSVKLQSRGSRESLTLVGKDKEKLSRSPALFRKKKGKITHVSTFRTYIEEDKKDAEDDA